MKRRTQNRESALSSPLIRRPIQRSFAIFLLPTFAAFCIGFIYPFLQGVYLSFCKFTTTSNARWIGLENYLKAFGDASFMHAFRFTALVAIASLIIINVLAFAVAYALTRGIKGSNSFRTVFFMPNLIGGIVLGYIWSMIFGGIHRAERHIRLLGAYHTHGMAADRVYDDHLYRRAAIGSGRHG
jgi:raffinose/stachyose/melibiose transport system permease protein